MESLYGWIYKDFLVSTLEDTKLTFQTHVLYPLALQHLPMP